MLHLDWSSWDDKGMHMLDDRSCQEPCAFINSKQFEDVATHQTMANARAKSIKKKQKILFKFSRQKASYGKRL